MDGESESGSTAVRLCEIKYDAESCGFNVTKSKWDPYPWVSSVEATSPAAVAGVQPGDCLLEVNGEDMLGLRVAEVASRIRLRGPSATVMLWNPGIHPDCDSGTICCGPMPSNLQRLVKCMTNIVDALECPVCFETTSPPAHQCVNGHIICLKCRTQTDKCPVCRVRIFRGRSLLCDQVFEAMVDAFDLRSEAEAARAQIITKKIGTRKKNKKPQIKINFLSPTKKFANRLLGRSSSVENLSYLKDYDCVAGQMIKSQSSSEICKASTTAGSTLNSRPGSGLLLDASDSCGGSARELSCRVKADVELIFVAQALSTSCLMAPACDEQVEIGQLKRHLQVHHNMPLLHYEGCKIKLNQSWLEEAIVVLACFNTMFFVRGVSFERLWVWTVDEAICQYTASIVVNDSTLHCDVIPLIGQQITDLEFKHFGLPLDGTKENGRKCIPLTIQQSSD